MPGAPIRILKVVGNGTEVTLQNISSRRIKRFRFVGKSVNYRGVAKIEIIKADFPVEAGEKLKVATSLPYYSKGVKFYEFWGDDMEAIEIDISVNPWLFGWTISQ